MSENNLSVPVVINRDTDADVFYDGLIVLQDVNKAFPNKDLTQLINDIETKGTFSDDQFLDALDSNATGFLDLSDNFAQEVSLFTEVDSFIAEHMPHLADGYQEMIADLPEPGQEGFDEALSRQVALANLIDQIGSNGERILSIIDTIPSEGTITQLFGDQGDPRYEAIADFHITNPNESFLYENYYLVVSLKDGSTRTVTINVGSSGPAGLPALPGKVLRIR